MTKTPHSAESIFPSLLGPGGENDPFLIISHQVPGNSVYFEHQNCDKHPEFWIQLAKGTPQYIYITIILYYIYYYYIYYYYILYIYIIYTYTPGKKRVSGYRFRYQLTCPLCTGVFLGNALQLFLGPLTQKQLTCLSSCNWGPWISTLIWDIFAIFWG